MQTLLLWSELDRQRLGFAGGESPDVPPPRAVDEGAESVEFFNRPREPNPIRIPQGPALKLLVDALERRGLANEQLPPGGASRRVQARERLAAASPVRLSDSAGPRR